MFFAFDGIDGSGKSTQIAQFVAWLKDQGHRVRQVRDPGTTAAGEAIREILLGASFRIDFRAEMLMYMACRAQLVDEEIRPALDRGEFVVSDRFLLATVVYQGVAGNLDPDDIWQVGRIATHDLLPDVTFVLDMDVATAQRRLGDQKDRIESRGKEYFEQVRRGFREQAERFPDAYAVIDADREIATIQADIRAAAQRALAANHGERQE